MIVINIVVIIVVMRFLPILPAAPRQGGILADEMGLGKTIQVPRRTRTHTHTLTDLVLLLCMFNVMYSYLYV